VSTASLLTFVPSAVKFLIMPQASWATGAIPIPALVVVCFDVACNILGGIYWAMSGFTPKPALAAAAG
jgi:hypothetical protein